MSPWPDDWLLQVFDRLALIRTGGMSMRQWRLLRGDVLVGELHEYDIDQPSFLARFWPGPGWEGVDGFFEAWASLSGPDPDGTRTHAVVKPLRDLGLTLVSDDERIVLEVFKNCSLRIDGLEARLRY